MSVQTLEVLCTSQIQNLYTVYRTLQIIYVSVQNDTFLYVTVQDTTIFLVLHQYSFLLIIRFADTSKH